MGIRSTQKLNKVLSALTGSILVLSTLLPGGILAPQKALAASSAYTFSSGPNYVTDTHAAIHNGTAQSEITWEDWASTDMSSFGSVYDMVSPSSSRVLLTAGDSIYVSTNSGATWSSNSIASFNAREMVLTSTDGTKDVVVVGQTDVDDDIAMYYSNDNGATWNSSVITAGGATGTQPLTQAAYDSTHNYVWGARADGALWRSTNGGGTFGAMTTIPLAGVTDLVWTGADRLVAVGDSVSAKLAFSSDSGTTWSTATLPGTVPALSAAGVANGYVYAAGANYMAVALASSDLSQSSSWTQINANITQNNFTAVQKFLNINGVMFAAVKETSVVSVVMYSTIDNGAHWFSHGVTGMDSTAVARVNTNGQILLGGVSNLGVVDVYRGIYSDSSASVVPNQAVEASTITSIAPTFYSLTENSTIGIAFGSTSEISGTWTYYNGSAWVDYTGNDSTKANTPASLTENILSTLPITNTIYLKIYLRNPAGGNSLFTILDSLLVEHDGSGGVIVGPDTTPPSSQVEALTPYINLASFPVTATSDDQDVAGVYLYVSTDGQNFTAWPNSNAPEIDTERPFSWNFTGENDTTYYFYSIARDLTGNMEQVPGGYDTRTTIDITAPYVTTEQPGDEDLEVARDQNITIEFSEAITPGSFTYSFRKTGGAEFTSAINWEMSNTRAIISHTALLEYATNYTVQIMTAEDRAENDIVEAADCPPNTECAQPLPLQWSFTTVPKQDPDLTRSKIEVESSHYAVNQHPKFTVTMTNDSTSTAMDAVAKIVFAEGITYQEGTARIVEGGGQLTTEVDDTGKTKLIWRGEVQHLEEIIFEFNANILTPTDLREILQGIEIYDNVHYFEDDSPYLPIAAEFTIDKSPDFDSSVKIVDKLEAAPGDDLTYTATIINTGDTLGDAYFNDVIPADTIFITSSITGTGSWDMLEYDAISNKVIGQAALSPDEEVSVSFRVRIDGNLSRDIDHYIDNIATVEDEDVMGSFYTLDTVRTWIPGEPVELEEPPEIVYQSPAHAEMGVRASASIVIGFNKSMDTSSLEYRINLSDGYTIDTSGWTETWSGFNHTNNAQVTLNPDEDLELGEEYTVEITNATDTGGNALTSCGVEDVSLCSPNPWNFTTAAPSLRIITRPVDADIVNLPVGFIDEEFVAQVYDQVTGYNYIVEEETTVRLLTTSTTGKFVRSNGTFLYNPGTGKWETQIREGRSETSFYYVDSVPTPEGTWDTLTAYDYPPQGWGAGIKKVIVDGTAELRSRLDIHTPKDRVLTDTFSDPIELRSYDKNNRRINLPQGRLYLHTSSTTGAFYDANLTRLPEWITAQALESNSIGNLQYMDISSQVNLASIYYKDTQDGFALLTLSDNAPINPDTGLENASTLMVVGDLELLDEEEDLEEELLEELEEVEDDTGREIKQLVLTPHDAELLPGDMQGFSVKAYDLDDNEIKGLKFKWYVIAEGGTIEKDGIDGDSTVSLFTAGDTPGEYLNTVLVATLYNKQLSYSTADINVVDMVDFPGGHLPITGMNTLQIIFMLLTLVSAVALAWVEHYEKTSVTQSHDQTSSSL